MYVKEYCEIKQNTFGTFNLSLCVSHLLIDDFIYAKKKNTCVRNRGYITNMKVESV